MSGSSPYINDKSTWKRSELQIKPISNYLYGAINFYGDEAITTQPARFGKILHFGTIIHVCSIENNDPNSLKIIYPEFDFTKHFQLTNRVCKRENWTSKLEQIASLKQSIDWYWFRNLVFVKTTYTFERAVKSSAYMESFKDIIFGPLCFVLGTFIIVNWTRFKSTS